MIYGQDAPVALPVADLYDSAMMQMYLGAVRDLYNTAQLEQKEFLKQYGDFYSPFARDNEYWYNNTMGPVQQLMQEAGSRGIDLTRSPEGRALIASTMRNIPYAKLAQIKRNAAAGEEYLKNRAALLRAGKYNPLYEQYILEQQGLPAFENWDTATMGAWTRTSPEEYKDLHDSTYQWVDNNKKRFLGMSPDNRYQIWGVSDNDLRSSLTPHLSGFVGNSLGGYHLANARREVLAEDPTLRGDRLEQAAMKRLQDNIVQANREYTYQEIQADPYTQQDRQFAQQMRMEQMKEAAADRRQAAAQLNAWNLARAKGEIATPGGGGEIPMGAGDQLETSQNIKYARNRAEFEKQEQDKAYKQQIHYYGKLNDADKKSAATYGKEYRVLLDKNATPEARKKAEDIVKKLNRKRDPNFLKWKQNFLNRFSAKDKEWIDSSTYQGAVNYKPSVNLSEAHNKSWEIFNKNNIVTDLESGAKLDLNTGLSYGQDSDGNRLGSMKAADRDFADIVVMQATGGRTAKAAGRKYTQKSVQQYVSNAIKGKQYKVTPQDVAGRRYGAGYIGGKQYNFIVEDATFTDPKVVDKLNGVSEYTLKQLGIRKTKDGYVVPIITKQAHGQGRANVNTATDKRIAGATQAGKYQPTRQARELSNEMLGM